jgi:hypothetical protein
MPENKKVRIMEKTKKKTARGEDEKEEQQNERGEEGREELKRGRRRR